MENVKIYCKDNSELHEYESINKGYRLDVFIEKDEELFSVNIYNITRLQQDFETEIENNGFYSIDANLVIVEEVNADNIKTTIQYLDDQEFFKKLKPIQKDKISIENFIKTENLVEL